MRRPEVAARQAVDAWANGIDGTISSAIGASLAGTPVTLLVGDVAVLHDATALAEAAALEALVRVVAVNNDGGGIFSFLPQATSPAINAELFERHWGTPHGLSLRHIASAMGMQARVISDLNTFREAVGSLIASPELIELTTDRTANVVHHQAIRDAVGEALRRGDEIEERA